MTIHYYIKMILLLTIITMMLLTKELENRFIKLGSQDEVPDPIVVAKFFHPFTDWVRYATEYDPVDRVFFGFVDGDFPEWGSFSLQELQSINIMSLPMERDKYWKEIPFSKLKTKNTQW